MGRAAGLYIHGSGWNLIIGPMQESDIVLPFLAECVHPFLKIFIHILAACFFSPWLVSPKALGFMFAPV